MTQLASTQQMASGARATFMHWEVQIRVWMSKLTIKDFWVDNNLGLVITVMGGLSGFLEMP